jgi:hypothetical protein
LMLYAYLVEPVYAPSPLVLILCCAICQSLNGDIKMLQYPLKPIERV